MEKYDKRMAFILLHGAWHDGWSWHAVGQKLKTYGYSFEAPDLPIDDSRATFDDYADIVVDRINNMDEVPTEVVLVGHSRSANVIPRVVGHAALKMHIKKQIYVCGSFEPATFGLSYQDAQALLPPKHQPGSDKLVVSVGDELARLHPESKVRQVYYNDCPVEFIEKAMRRLRLQRLPTNVEPLSHWPEVPTDYIYCINDKLLNPIYSQVVAKKVLGVTPIKLPGGHFSPLFRYPEKTAQILVDLIR